MIDVSVIIPTFEAGYELVVAIESVIIQEGITAEVILIEDGSISPSNQLVKEYLADYFECDNAQIFYHHQSNAGAYRARLNAVKLCRGRYIKFLDQDDVLLNGSLLKEVQSFDQDIDVVLSDWIVGESNESGISRSIQNKKHMKAPLFSDPINDFLTVGGVFTSAALYKKKSVTSALKPVTSFTPVKADDWLIFAQVCLSGARYKTIDNVAYIWVQNDQQLSRLSRHKLISEHFNILNWIESNLEKTDRLTDERKFLLANYYAKQLLEAFDKDKALYQKLVEKIKFLYPGYKQQHGNIIYKTLCHLLGFNTGVKTYMGIKSRLTFLR